MGSRRSAQARFVVAGTLLMACAGWPVALLAQHSPRDPNRPGAVPPSRQDQRDRAPRPPTPPAQPSDDQGDDQGESPEGDMPDGDSPTDDAPSDQAPGDQAPTDTPPLDLPPEGDFDPRRVPGTGVPAGDPAANPGDGVQQSPEEAALARRGEPRPGDYIEQLRPREFLLSVNIVLRSPATGMSAGGPNRPFDEDAKYQFQTASLVFPMLSQTASSRVLGMVNNWVEADGTGRDQGNRTALAIGYRGRMIVDDEMVDSMPETLTQGYPPGTQLARWDFNPGAPVSARTIELQLEFPTRTYATEFNEEAARSVPWPRAYPQSLRGALKPQIYIEKGVTNDGKIQDYDPAPIQAAVREALAEQQITDVTRSSPAVVAKAITGYVWRNVQPSGPAMELRGDNRAFEGITIKAPAITLAEKRGTEHDIAALLAAMLRSAGLPVRTPVGYDMSDDEDRPLGAGRGQRTIRSWVEFALYDEAAHTVNWVPIDVVRARSSGGQRPPRFDQRWRNFGTIEDLARVIPFTLTFAPPTDVAMYQTTGFWGWFVTPSTPPLGYQTITFSASALPRRHNEPEAEPVRTPKSREQPRRGGLGRD